MTDEYTPTTAVVEAAYVAWRLRNSGAGYHMTVHEDGSTSGPLVEFQRWLSLVEDEAASDAGYAVRRGYM